MPNFRPKDFIAFSVLIIYAVLKTLGIDGALDPALFLILGYYFVKRGNGQDNGK